MEESKLKEIFCKADQKGTADGFVTPGELKRLITEEFGNYICDKDLAMMFSDLDKNKDGKITEKEFLDEMMKKNRRKAFHDMFVEMDKDGSKTLTKQEVREVLVRLCVKEEEIDCLFSGVDLNQDGIISYDEFMAMV